MKEKTKQKEVKLLQPKIDIVFQSLFNAKNKEITKSFVEALLEEKNRFNDNKQRKRNN